MRRLDGGKRYMPVASRSEILEMLGNPGPSRLVSIVRGSSGSGGLQAGAANHNLDASWRRIGVGMTTGRLVHCRLLSLQAVDRVDRHAIYLSWRLDRAASDRGAIGGDRR